MFVLFVSMFLYLLLFVVIPVAGIYIVSTKRFKDDLLRNYGGSEARINKIIKMVQIWLSLMLIIFLIKVFIRLFIDHDVKNLHNFLYNLF